MRTTVTIDNDVYAIARQLAALKHSSIGEALSELARRGLERDSQSGAEDVFPTFHVSENAPPFGPSDVAAAEDEA